MLREMRKGHQKFSIKPVTILKRLVKIAHPSLYQLREVSSIEEAKIIVERLKEQIKKETDR